MSMKGIRQAWACRKGTLSSTPPLSIVTFGNLLSGSQHVWEDSGITEQREGILPFLMNNKITLKTSQMTLQTLYDLIAVHLQNKGMDLQVVQEKDSTATYGGIFNFDGANWMGFDFTWLLSRTENSLQVDFQRSFPIDVWTQIMATSVINTPRDLNALGLGNKGVDQTKHKYPNPYIATFPHPTLWLNGYEIRDHKVSLKTESDMSEFDIPEVKWILAEVEFTVAKDRGTEILTQYNSNRLGELQFQERNPDGTIVTYVFGPGVLINTRSFTVGKDNRDFKIMFKRRIPAYDFTVNPTTRQVTVYETV